MIPLAAKLTATKSVCANSGFTPMRENLVEAVPEYRTSLPTRHWDEHEFRVPVLARVDEALADIHHQCALRSVDESEWMVDLQNLAGDEIARVILSGSIKHQVTPEALLNGLNRSGLGLE